MINLGPPFRTNKCKKERKFIKSRQQFFMPYLQTIIVIKLKYGSSWATAKQNVTVSTVLVPKQKSNDRNSVR
jgi:hypothetical protein